MPQKRTEAGSADAAGEDSSEKDSNPQKKERANYNRLVMLCHTPNNNCEEQYIYATSIKSSGITAAEVKDLVLNSKERKKKRRLSVYGDQRYFQVLAKVEKGKRINTCMQLSSMLLRPSSQSAPSPR